jgi:hypothetical protein
MVFSVGLLTAWYGAQASQSLALSASRNAAPSPSSSAAAQRNNDVLPPWDPRGEIVALDALRRDVLADGQFFDSTLRNFSSLDVSEDEKTLFALHQGLRKLQSLATPASEKGASSADVSFWSRRFNEGVTQLNSFFDDISLEGVSVVKGEDLSKAESTLAISRGRSEYLGGVIHTGAFDAEVSALTGDAAFTITVRKNGADTAINIDLSDMGATPRTLDNVAAHINAQLENAGMVSRIERAKIGEKDDNGIVQGDDYGFKIEGVITERLSFSDAGGAPAVWTAGVSGGTDDAAGQLVKFVDIASGGSAEFARRIEADPTVTETTNEDGETSTTNTSNPLEVLATARGQDGGIYVLGQTANTVEGQNIKGEQDLVLMRYDTTGKKVWTRTLGAGGEASGTSLAINASGDVIVAGSIKGVLGTTTDLGGTDSLVVKYSSDGVEQWARRFGATADDQVNSVTVANDGTVYVAGEAGSAIGGVASQGGVDGYVRALDANGNTLYTRAAEAGAGTERAKAVTLAADGGLLVASEADGRAVLAKYAAGDDGTGTPAWTIDLGDLDGGRIEDIDIGDDGAIYLAGAAGAGFAPGNTVTANSGGRDAVLIKLSETGGGTGVQVDYTTFLGTAEDNAANAVEVTGGVAYLAGKTSGALPGSVQNGDRNAFAAGFDTATGALSWTQQVAGRGGLSEAKGVIVDPGGDSVLDRFGLPSGEVMYADSRVITARSSVREGDHFFVQVDDGRKRKITIDADDTMRSLTFKLNAVLVLDANADVRRSSEGDQLRIKPNEGVTVTLSAGADGQNALDGLGLPEGSIRGKASLLDRDEDSTSDGPKVFALELPRVLDISDRDAALKASEALADAQSKVQRAWRDLTLDPALRDLLEGGSGPGNRGGTAPAYLTAQVANYTAGLQRLQAGPSAGSTIGLF